MGKRPIKVTSPTGVDVPVPADVKAGRVLYWERRGFTLEWADEPDEVVVPAGDPVEAWTNAQLTAWAKANDVDLAGATKKDELLAAIAAATQSS